MDINQNLMKNSSPFYNVIAWNPGPLIKGGWDFSEMAVMGGDGEFLQEMGEPGMGGWFYNGRIGKSPYIAYPPPFSNFVFCLHSKI